MRNGVYSEIVLCIMPHSGTRWRSTGDAAVTTASADIEVSLVDTRPRLSMYATRRITTIWSQNEISKASLQSRLGTATLPHDHQTIAHRASRRDGEERRFCQRRRR